MIPRFIKNQVVKALAPGRVVGIFGPRRSGKTVLMQTIREELREEKILFVNGDNLEAAEALSSQKLNILSKFVGRYDYLFVDEAQVISRIGMNLKLLVDHFSKLCVLVSGSSSFDLRHQIGEPLVGRTRYFHLYPLSLLELAPLKDYLHLQDMIETQLIYGSYPQVYSADILEDKRQILESIRDGYLLKDILQLDNLKDSLFVFQLLRLVAFQIGNDISYTELANNLSVNKKTVMRYLELLEKSFVVFPLYGFSRNLRKEYTKTPRYFFWDNGIRNAVIANYNRLIQRDDVGKLWENFCIVERIKKTMYKNIYSNRYFWRTYDQKEIDYLEERGGKLYGFEFKWREKKVKPPDDFLTTYSNSSFEVIHRENFLEFVS